MKYQAHIFKLIRVDTINRLLPDEVTYESDEKLPNNQGRDFSLYFSSILKFLFGD